MAENEKYSELNQEERPELEEQEAMPETGRWRPSPEIQREAELIMSAVWPKKLNPTPAQIEDIYRYACNLYKTGKYNDARPYFHLISMTNVQDPRYAMGIAACYHMLKNYKAAIQSYTLVSFVDPDNPIPQYHLADCFMHMNEPVGAYIALEMALTRCKKNPKKYKGLMHRVTLMLNRLKAEFAEKKAKGITTFRSGELSPEDIAIIEKRMPQLGKLNKPKD